jgi:hypothetical protein
LSETIAIHEALKPLAKKQSSDTAPQVRRFSFRT